MSTPANDPQSPDERISADMEKDTHIRHQEEEESRAMSNMFADAAIATGQHSFTNGPL